MPSATSHDPSHALLIYRGRRCIDDSSTCNWPEARRQAYLLKTDVPVPWSLDVRVLPESDGDVQGSNWGEVACTVVAAGPAHDHDLWRGSEVYGANPSPPTWKLMGYDVCDITGTSGLSNCGYSPADVAALRKRWASSLNDCHLFRAFDEALLFCRDADVRVPEHAPFFVIGIWLLTQ
jgi:hypothetical protein